jgi:hypothetical protein
VTLLISTSAFWSSPVVAAAGVSGNDRTEKRGKEQMCLNEIHPKLLILTGAFWSSRGVVAASSVIFGRY